MTVNLHDRLLLPAACMLVATSLLIHAAAAASDEQPLAPNTAMFQSQCGTDDMACLRKLLQADPATYHQEAVSDRKLLGSDKHKKADMTKKDATKKVDMNKGSKDKSTAGSTKGNSNNGNSDIVKNKGKGKDAPPTLGHGDGKGKYFAKKAYEKNLLHFQNVQYNQKLKDKYGPHHKSKHG